MSYVSVIIKCMNGNTEIYVANYFINHRLMTRQSVEEQYVKDNKECYVVIYALDFVSYLNSGLNI